MAMDAGGRFCHAPFMLTRREVCVAVGGAAAVLLPHQAAGAQTPPPGQLVALLTPIRVFDTRVDPHRKIQSGENMGVFISAAVEGTNPSAAFVNLTITETEGAGYLVVFASDLTGERPLPSTSNINWSTSGVTLANMALTAVGGENAIAVHCDGGGRTHFIIDVYGYVP